MRTFAAFLFLFAIAAYGTPTPAESPLPSPTASAGGSPAMPAPPPAETYFTMSVEEFRALAPAQQPIDLQSIDHDLLSAAVFHETNAQRVERQLPPLRYQAAVWQAAAIQAIALARAGLMGHAYPSPSEAKSTPWDRVQFVGLNPRFAAENVATAFGLQYEDGRPFFTRIENGREIYSYEPASEPIPPHTYLSFAQQLVSDWMASEGHRANILAVEPEFLGCSSQQGKDSAGMPIFYCAQVFFTPLGPPSEMPEVSPASTPEESPASPAPAPAP